MSLLSAMLPQIVPLSQHHVKSSFDCGMPLLNTFLHKYATQNAKNDASKTYVYISQSSNEVAGYYTLSYGSTNPSSAPMRVRKNMPHYPIPVLMIGRLAVDKKYQGLGLGAALLKDALLKAIEASHIAGLKAVVVSAKNDIAVEFYKKFDFEESMLDKYSLMLPISVIEKIMK